MDGEIQEVIYCADDDEYRVSCDICDELCIERFFENHLKSQTHNKIFMERFQIIPFN